MENWSSTVRLLLRVLVAGAVGLAGVACGNDGAPTGVDVVNPRLVQTPAGERSFLGTLVNERSRPLSIAQIEVTLYDERGSAVETIRISVKDVPARDSVAFSEKIDSDRAFTQAQIKRILAP